jgi:hypothetical protein
MLRKPVGVCEQIIPWNFPLLFVAGKLRRRSLAATPSFSSLLSNPVDCPPFRRTGSRSCDCDAQHLLYCCRLCVDSYIVGITCSRPEADRNQDPVDWKLVTNTTETWNGVHTARRIETADLCALIRKFAEIRSWAARHDIISSRS